MKPDLVALEEQLARLRPTARLHREEMLFEAGRRSGQRSARRWQWATTALSAACVGLAIGWMQSMSTVPPSITAPTVLAERPVEPTMPEPTVEPEAPTPRRALRLGSSLLAVRDRMAYLGGDHWSTASTPIGTDADDEVRPAVTVWELQQQLRVQAQQSF